MEVKLLFKKVGNHWYPDIYHYNSYEIELDEKIEKVLFMVSQGSSEVEFCIEQEDIVLDDVILFDDEDILRYMITDDDFDIKIYIRGHEFLISSDLYFLLEQQFNFDFQNNYYKIVYINDI